MSSGRPPARISYEAEPPPASVKIGRDLETGKDVFIGDVERRTGLYVLGRSGTGKSTLLVNLMDQDIGNGHGVFFLDPHGAAISQLVGTGRHLPRIQSDLAIIDPEDKTHSFGINLLACADITDRDARRDTYKRAYGAFERIWEKDFDDKPWLQLFIQSTLYALIETQEYTLAEMPLFLDAKNADFRYYIVKNITYNKRVARFWYSEFTRPEREQQERLDAAYTRAHTLLDHDDVIHIVGQKETTIDFAKIMAEQRILLLRLSAALSADVKKFIGTILLSELLHAVRKRPTVHPRQFCIFIDEVQHFATSEDFSTLFTEARKYGIATTIAHQERFGQLADNKPILGATDAAGNKVLFTLSNEDAAKLAPEFAKRPPREIKYEQQLGISQDPIDVLLKGHNNPQIKRFVNQYLRPVRERRDDTREDMEVERLLRMDHLDEAALYRIDEHLLPQDPEYVSLRRSTLERAQGALSQTRIQTRRLINLHDTAISLRERIRYLNRLLVLIMEGEIKPTYGDEAFTEFLRSLIDASSYVPKHLAELLKLYISLVYGDPTTPRAIPFAFAQTHGLLPAVVTTILQAAADIDKREKEAFRNESWNRIQSGAKQAEESLQTLQESFRDCIRREISNWELKITGAYTTDHYIELYILIYEYPRVAEILAPYLSARFADPWRSHFSDWARKEAARILENIHLERQRAVQGVTYFDHVNPEPSSWNALRDWLRGERFLPPYPGEETLYEISLLDAFEQFLTRYGEGAIIALILLLTLEDPVRWRKEACVRVDKHLQTKLTEGSYEYRTLEHVYSAYPLYNMLYLPSLQNREPIEILRSLAELISVLRSCGAESVAKYTWHCPEYFDYDRSGPSDRQKYRPREWYRTRIDYFQLCRHTEYVEELEWLQGRHVPGAWLDKGEVGSWLHDAQILKRALDGPGLFPNAGGDHVILPRWWIEGDSLLRAYLRARAWSIARYGSEVADKTFPRPTIAGAKGFQVAQIIDFMVKVLQDEEKKEEKKRISELVKRQEQKAQEQFDEKFRNRVIPLPDRLEARVLSEVERERIKVACWKEISGYAYVDAVLVVVNDFVEFCRLLSLPENHIKDKTGQYVEREVPGRTVRDMMDEMAAFELSRLPDYHAYAKINQRQDGEPIVYIGKIRTMPPPSVSKRVFAEHPGIDIEREAIEMGCLWYCKTRSAIEREIHQRQKRWLRLDLEGPPLSWPGRELLTSTSSSGPPPTSEGPPLPEKPTELPSQPKPLVWGEDPPPWKRKRT